MKINALLFTVAVILLFVLFVLQKCAFPQTLPNPAEIKAVYLGTPHIFNQKKIAELENILATTDANGIVIDFKDNNDLSQNYLAALITRFKNRGIYTIARTVTFQDAYLAKKHPGIAVRKPSGAFWYDGGYWVDPASELAQNYNIEIAKRAIAAGADEIQFDYIRFPTGKNMKDMHFPIFDPKRQNKSEVIEAFSQKARKEIKNFSPNTLMGIDLFGEVFIYGKEPGIGQNLKNLAESFDVFCNMSYPTHHKCGEFGLHDPSIDPYKVYYVTLKNGLKVLDGKKTIIRPWIQDFSIKNIYGCGPKIIYSKDKVTAQIQACRDLGINGFMLWNAGSKFTTGVLE